MFFFRIVLCTATLSLACGVLPAFADTLFDNQVKKWELRAAKGDRRALYKLGRAYWEGRAVKKDVQKSIKYLVLAANQRYSKAAYRLGTIYSTKSSEYKSDRQAYRWFERAAKQGHGMSQYRLGLMLYEGKGIEKNYASALTWATRAKKQNVLGASALVTRILEARQVKLTQVKIEKNNKKKKTVAKKNLKRSPTPKVAQKKATLYKTQQVLSRAFWKSDGKPTHLMPSLLSACEKNSRRIRCITKDLTMKRDDFTAEYEVISILTNFSNKGTFNIRYRLNFRSVKPEISESIDEEDELPKIGLQKTTNKMRCQILDRQRIKCYTDEFQVVRFHQHILSKK
jgi:hypothetical protein